MISSYLRRTWNPRRPLEKEPSLPKGSLELSCYSRAYVRVPFGNGESKKRLRGEDQGTL